MKAFAATVLTCMMLCGSISALPVHAAGGVSVGVKRGDWAEYSVDITGNPPPIHNVTWMRMEVLQVNGDAFPVNLTVRYRNGTLYSSIWQFNFTAGNTEGWIIVPSNLGVGDSFYDVFNKTGSQITIRGQTQKVVAGADRTVTYGSDSLRQKEWDKDTGVFVSSYEAFENWTAEVNMTATNLWGKTTPSQNQATTYALAAGVTGVAASASCASAVYTNRKRRKKHGQASFGGDKAC